MPDTTSKGMFFGTPPSQSGILNARRQARFEAMLNNVSAHNGLRVATNPTGGLAFFAQLGGYTKINRFRIVRAGDNSVKVMYGVWSRNGYINGLTCDVGEAFKTLSSLTGNDTTYYIYIQLESASNTEEIKPDEVTANSTLTPPASGDRFNRKLYLGQVTTNGSGVVTVGGIQQWYVGDIDDDAIVPDGESLYSGTTPHIQTIGFNPTGGRHYEETQIWGAEGSWPSEYRFPMLDKDSNGSGAMEWAVFDADDGGDDAGTYGSIQKITGPIFQQWGWSTPTTIRPDDEDMIELRQNTTKRQKYCRWEDAIDYIAQDLLDGPWNPPPWESVQAISHHYLAGLNDQADDADHDWAWSNAQTGYDATFNRNYGESIGNTTPQKVIDLTNEQLLPGGAAATLDWGNETLLHAAVAVLDWANTLLKTAAGVKVADWGASKLYESTGKVVVDWGVGRLQASGAAVMLDWLSVANEVGIGPAGGIDLRGYNKVRADNVFNHNGSDGATGSFTSADGTPKTITVNGGIITAIT